MTAVEGFHFLRPLWFLALFPAALLLFLLLRRHSAGSAWEGLVDANLLRHLWLQEPGKLRRLPFVLLGLAWLLAVIALAGPVWERQPQPVFQAQAARIIVLDLSASMDAADIKPSRLMRARFKITDILNRSREGRTGLVVFAAEPHLVTPLTDDTATLAAMLPALGTDIMPVQGDSGAAAIQMASLLLERAGEKHGEVLLVSDGVGDQAAMIGSARALRSQGHRLSILGVGSGQGVPSTVAGQAAIAGLDYSVLTEMARAGGGVYSALTADDGDLERVLLSPDKAQMNIREDTGSGVERWIERGGWLLPVVLLLAASGFRRNLLGIFLCGLLLVPPPAQAWEWSGLWLNSDQRAARELKKGEPEQAAQQFNNQAWKGMAQYSAGDFAAAAETFEQLDSATGAYNRGNALAQNGQLEEAAQAYRDTLAKAPGHADAKANLELLESLLQQQEQQQDNQQGDGEGEEQEQQQDSQQGEGEDENQQQQAQSGENSEQDSAAAAKQDVEDSAKAEDSEKEQDATRQPGRQDQSEAENAQAEQMENQGREEPKNEQEIALEQWLQQIPDDPGGLLRRKFMLEHLERQRGARR